MKKPFALLIPFIITLVVFHAQVQLVSGDWGAEGGGGEPKGCCQTGPWECHMVTQSECNSLGGAWKGVCASCSGGRCKTECEEGCYRCDGDFLDKCENGCWVTKKVCDYGCKETGYCQASCKTPSTTTPPHEYEICDNNKDDDHDGLIDCADPDCAGKTGPNTDRKTSKEIEIEIENSISENRWVGKK